MSEGHPNARHYPIAYLWSEARIAKRRIRGQIQMQVMGFHVAAVQVMAGGRLLEQFNSFLESDE